MPKLKSYTSTCSYCGTGCGIVIKKDAHNRITVEGDPEHPVNRGMLCTKGSTLHYTVQDKTDRLLHPTMRTNRQAAMTKVSWAVAIQRAAKVFSSLIKRYGPDSVAFYVSGQLLTEEYYLVNKLVKGFLGTNNIDTNSRLCMSSAVVGYKKTLGEDAVPASYADIELADTFLIAGANPAWCHPILFRRLEQHKEANPAVRIVVVDPRRTQSCSIADLHLQIKPGTDIFLYKAIGRLLIESGQIDHEFIEKHVDGFAAYQQAVQEHTLEQAAEICGIEAEQIETAASYIGEAKGFVSMWAMGLNQSSVGVNKNLNLLALSLITGHIGRPGSGPLSLTGQPNAMGGREVGGLSTMLAAHRDYTNPESRKEVAEYWGVPSLPDRPGLTATEMMDKLASGELKAIWIICTNPIVSWPNARKAELALEKAKFVVVQDISNRSDTLPYADLVLPAAGYLEKEGTMTNSERRISYLPQVFDPPGEALPDYRILQLFAQEMGYGAAFAYQGPEDIYREHALLTKGTNIDVSGVTYALLRERKSVQWPFPEGATRGTTRLFADFKFYTPNQRAQLFATPSPHQSEATDPEHPFVLTTGRIRDQWHTMTRTGKVQKLNQHIPAPFVEIHPLDANALGIRQGDLLRISNRRGEVLAPATLSPDIRLGVVFLPMHWGKTLQQDTHRANNLTSELVDTASKQPDFKYAAVQVHKHANAPKRICVVGAGAAAFRLVQVLQEQHAPHHITVFSKEETPFYNRVLLPEYISGKKEWQRLLKLDPHSSAPACNIVAGVGIEKIDRTNRLIVDSQGRTHPYDLLVLATGSAAVVPPSVPKNLHGIHTLRSRVDAENIRQIAKEQQTAVIVGGGILGIELAGALNELGLQVVVIQRSSRLMDRQLDETASQLLDLELQDRDIRIVYNDEVQQYLGETQLKAVRLKSGRTISCGLLVFAIGTRPEISLALDAKIECGRGVVVNSFFQTNDPAVFAIGEIAEFRKQLFGITAAAEEQAELLAQYLLGDHSKPYTGSVMMNILKLDGLELCSIGLTKTPPSDKDYEEILFSDLKRRQYKKCIVHKDRLVGCVLAGSKAEFLDFKNLIVNRVELGDKRSLLLQSSAPTRQTKGQLVCACNSVGTENLHEALHNGHNTLEALCQNTGAGTGCGSCKPELKAFLLNNISPATPHTVPHPTPTLIPTPHETR